MFLGQSLISSHSKSAAKRSISLTSLTPFQVQGKIFVTGARETAQQLSSLAAPTEDPTSVPSTLRLVPNLP